MEHRCCRRSRRSVSEWPLGIVWLFALASLLRGGSGNLWTPVALGGLAAALAIDRKFRDRAFGALREAWRRAAAFPAEAGLIPWRAALLLVALPDACFLMLRDQGIQSGDSRPVVLTATSLVRRQSMELAPFAESYARLRLFTSGDEPPYFFLYRRDGVYSRYPSGMVLFALPIVTASWLLGADLDAPTVHERVEKLTAAGVSAACLGLFFLLALHIVEARAALTTSWLLAIGSVMFSTVGQALWQHGGVIFWTEVLLLIEFRCWRQANWKVAAFEGAACAMMLACRLSAGLIVATFCAWVFVRSPRRALAIAAWAVIGIAPWATMNGLIYGTPLGPSTEQTSAGLWAAGNASAWLGVLFSPTHGLAVYQPWLLLGLLAVLPAVRKQLPAPRALLPPGWRTWALVVIGLQLAIVSSWWCWWGGWCWGSRLASEAVPLAALLSLAPIGMLLTTARGRAVIVTLAIVSALVHIPSVYLRQWRWYGENDWQENRDHWRWTAPPFLFPLRR